MSKRVSLALRWGLLAVMCIIIFTFSGFPADESTEQSSFAVDLIIRAFFHSFDDYSSAHQEALVSLLTVAVRKGAHFAEYALLCVLAFGAFIGVKRHLPRWALAVLFSFAYASSDEFHQLFVPGRAGMWGDVLVDTSGAIVGGLIACFVSMMIAARRVLRDKDNSKI